MYLDISDGTTTVVLSGTAPVLGCTYFPDTAQYRNKTWQPVTESAEVNLRGTAANIRATVATIGRLLQQAIDRQTSGVGPRVYVNYKPVDGDSTAFRAEVFEGRPVWSTNPGLRRLGDTNPTAQIAVIWTRAPGWDDGTETEAAISAQGAGAATGGRTVYNNPANGNWIQAAAAQVGGDMPTPVRIQLTNTTGGSVNYTKLFLAVNSYSDPANLVHYLQAEAASGAPVVANDPTYSGSGSNWLSIVASGGPTWLYTLPAADLQRTRGRRFRLLARFGEVFGDSLYVRPSIRDAGGTVTLWTGDEMSVGGTAAAGGVWRDMGVVPLPPGGYNSAYGALTLALTWRGTATGTYLDVLQLAPLDSYRSIVMPSTTVANNAAIVFDGIEGLMYTVTAGARAPVANAYTGPLMVQPNTLQRIYVLHETGTGAPIGNAFSVQLFYRKRRLVV